MTQSKPLSDEVKSSSTTLLAASSWFSSTCSLLTSKLSCLCTNSLLAWCANSLIALCANSLLGTGSCSCITFWCYSEPLFPLSYITLLARFSCDSRFQPDCLPILVVSSLLRQSELAWPTAPHRLQKFGQFSISTNTKNSIFFLCTKSFSGIAFARSMSIKTLIKRDQFPCRASSYLL